MSGQQSNVIDDGQTPVKHAFINPAATGNTAAVAAVAGKRILVCGVAAVTTLANTVKFQSATTDICSGKPLAANGGYVLPYNPYGWFKTAIGEALNANLSVATATGIGIAYKEIF